MVFLYIFIGLLLILFLILIIPIRLEVKYEVNTDLNESNKEQLNTLNYVNIYILYFIKIKKLEMKNKQNSNLKEGSTSRKNVFDMIYKFLLDFLNFKKIDNALLNYKDIKCINNNIFFEKIDLNIGINFKDVLYNAYIISFLNAIINMYFAKNSDKINFNKTNYITYISNKIFNIKVDSIIRVNLVNTIIVIIKIIIRFRKVVNKDGRTTSNRKLNDDSYDFT